MAAASSFFRVKPAPARRAGFAHYLIVAVLILAVIFYAMPIYVMVVNGLKSKSYMTLDQMWHLPRGLAGNGFPAAWDALSPNLMNSFKIAIPATIISAMLGALNGYLLSKWKFRGSDLIFTLILFGMFIPYQSILVALIQTLQRLGLYGHWYGLVVVHIVYGIPICTLIFRNYFANVPNELLEAARVDG